LDRLLDRANYERMPQRGTHLDLDQWPGNFDPKFVQHVPDAVA
jgi:hypothetical protein